MTTQERFAEDWKMPMVDVLKLVRLARYAGRCSEHACNGDAPDEPTAHDKTDKNGNDEYWHAAQRRYDSDILALIAPYGFTGIEYTGLGPTLKRGTQFVEVPY